MVLDNEVSVIVMITKLVENGVIKAHQYWPDEDNTTLKLENNIEVIFESEETDKGLDRRSFVVSNGGNI
jgi:protein tyrosine phosphatase